MHTPNIPLARVTPGIFKARTGVVGLDELTGGGLPGGRPTLVCGAAGNFLAALREEQRGGIFDFLQPQFAHFKHAYFIRRAETVFHGAENTERMAAVALEVKHGVYHVFEDAGAGDLDEGVRYKLSNVRTAMKD